ncbi:hypothetical protein TURU_070380 [Turdus rufiventris]|nr:hypothetical protein TURU_070380 [Turdus rufiventris]
MVKGLEGKLYEEQPGGDLTVVFNILMRGRRGAGADLFTLCPVTSDRTRANGLKLCQERFKLGIRKRAKSEQNSVTDALRGYLEQRLVSAKGIK